MSFRFGEFELDDRLFELRRAGQPVALTPRIHDLLRYLVEHRDRVVTKEELTRAVWTDVRVTGNSLVQAVRELRRTLGESGDEQGAVQTIRGRGYRFVAPTIASEPEAPIAPVDTAPVAPSEPAGGELPLVGRDGALDALLARLERTRRGAGGAVLLAGEPGIGKTRLVEEFAATARAQGVRVLVGRCHEGEGAPAFWPWTQALRTLLEDPRSAAAVEQDAPREFGAILAQLGQPGAPALQSLAATPEDRFRVFDAVTMLASRHATVTPLLVVLDDLHWADEPSLRLLAYFVQNLRHARVLVAGTYRTTGNPTARLVQATAAITRADPASLLTLEGLSREAIGVFVRGSTGETPSDEDLARLEHATAGNPLFLTHLRRTGFKGPLPDDVAQAIVRHLDVLDAPSRRALTVASVLGREFTVPLLATVAGVAYDELVELLEGAARARVVVRAGAPEAWRFSHVLVRDALYAFLAARDKSALHAAAADALAPRAPAATVAYHYEKAARAGYAERAVEFAIRAAEQAVEQFAFEAAIEHYARTLELLEIAAPDDVRRRIDALMGLGLARWRAADAVASREAFELAATLARDAGMADATARASFLAALAPESSKPDATRITLLEASLAMLGDAPTATAALCTARLAYALWATGDVARRVELTERALSTARASGDTEAMVYALTARHYHLWIQAADDDTRRALATELATLVGESRSEGAVLLLMMRVDDAALAGDAAALEAAIGGFERLAAELRQPYLRWYGLVYRAMLALAGGRLGETEALIEQRRLIDAYAPTGPREQWFHVQMFLLRRAQGRLLEHEPVVRMIRTAMPEIGAWLSAEGLLLFEKGETEAARRILRSRVDGRIEISRDVNYPITVLNFGELAARLGDRSAAALLYPALLPWAGRQIVVGHCAVSGCASTVLGALAACLARWDEAESHFACAVEVEERFGAPIGAATARVVWSEALLARDAPGDRARARGLIDRATEAGAASLEGRIAQLTEALRAEPRARSETRPRSHTPDAAALAGATDTPARRRRSEYSR